MEEHDALPVPWLVFSLFQIRTTCPGVALPTVSWAPTSAVINQDNVSTGIHPPGQLDLGVPSAETPSPQVTLGCIKYKVRPNQATI